MKSKIIDSLIRFINWFNFDEFSVIKDKGISIFKIIFVLSLAADIFLLLINLI